METPVLFYVACIIAFVTQHVDELLWILAAVYVGLRIIHSIIHCSYNNVMHRFKVYFVSSIVLWVLWAILAYRLFSVCFLK